MVEGLAVKAHAASYIILRSGARAVPNWVERADSAETCNRFDRFDPPKPDPAIRPIGKPAFNQWEYEAYKRGVTAEAAKPKEPTLTPVDYNPFVGPAIRAAIVTVAIGLGITGTACLAVFGFFAGLGGSLPDSCGTRLW
jgi:hypothetical protein